MTGAISIEPAAIGGADGNCRRGGNRLVGTELIAATGSVAAIDAGLIDGTTCRSPAGRDGAEPLHIGGGGL